MLGTLHYIHSAHLWKDHYIHIAHLCRNNIRRDSPAFNESFEDTVAVRVATVRAPTNIARQQISLPKCCVYVCMHA
jgi:hypothetical protein